MNKHQKQHEEDRKSYARLVKKTGGYPHLSIGRRLPTPELKQFSQQLIAWDDWHHDRKPKKKKRKK